MAAGLISFATSGSTGEPVNWLRTPAQLRAEVELVAEAAFGRVEAVVSFAPPDHLFGRLFARELPEWQHIPVHDAWREPATPPDFHPGLRTLFVCVPSTWPLLRAITGRIAALPSAAALHGTGPVPPAALTVVAALADANFRAVEIFGSTESGGIATKNLGTDDPWELLNDVTLLGEAEAGQQLLEVHSPRLARREGDQDQPASWRSTDLIQRTGPRHFHFLGRTSRLIKVNGLRTDLEQLERALKAHYPQADLACVPVRDDTRGEHYELFHTTRIDPAEIAAVTAKAGFPVPRRVHQVPEIPRSATGKIQADKLGHHNPAD